MKASFLTITALCGLSLLTMPRPYSPVPISEDHLERARAYLDEHHLPLPEGWEWHRHDFGDGQMRWGKVTAPEDKGTLIFVPGYSNYVEAYAGMIRDWHAAGLTVIAVDLPGQGGSTRRSDYPEKAWTGDFSWYGEKIAGFIAARTAEATSPVTVAGESFGAHVSLRAAADGHLDVERIALIVPGLAFNTSDGSADILRQYASIMTRIGYGNRYVPTQGQWKPKWDEPLDEFGCATRPDRIYHKDAVYSLKPELRIGGITNEWTNGFESSGEDLVTSGKLQTVQSDILMILAENDEILDYERTLMACDEQLPNCRRVELPGAGHCLLLEEDEVSDPMIEAVAKFAGGFSLATTSRQSVAK